jgi:energy-coupling factor transporter transmembrane protein EcfT
MLFEYQRRATPIHHLHPLAKAVWLLGMGILLSFYFDPRVIVVVLLLVLPVIYLARVPWRRWWKPIAFVTLLSTISFLIISLWLSRPGSFSRYPEWTQVTFLQIAGPDFVLGRMAITLAGLAYVAGQTLRTVTMLLTVAVFIYTTAPSDLVYLMVQARLPSKLVFIVMAAYRFFPHIFRKLSSVTTAQRLRGWELRSRNPVTLAREYMPITIPVLAETVRISDFTARAVESRAFGAARFTLHHELRLRREDWLFIAFWLAVAALGLTLLAVYGVGKL